MLHGIINKQGNYLGVRVNISEKILFNMFTYKSLASGALFLGILVNADNKLMDLCYRCYIIFFISYLQKSMILKILRYK